MQCATRLAELLTSAVQARQGAKSALEEAKKAQKHADEKWQRANKKLKA